MQAYGTGRDSGRVWQTEEVGRRLWECGVGHLVARFPHLPACTSSPAMTLTYAHAATHAHTNTCSNTHAHSHSHKQGLNCPLSCSPLCPQARTLTVPPLLSPALSPAPYPQAHTLTVTQLAWSHDSRLLLAASRDRSFSITERGAAEEGAEGQPLGGGQVGEGCGTARGGAG